MVQINIDTDKDSSETIAKIIELLHVAIRNQSTSSTPSSIYDSSIIPTTSSSSPFDMFGSSPDSNSQSSNLLPSSAPIQKSEPSMFDIFGAEDRSNQQVSSPAPQFSNPFDIFSDSQNSSSLNVEPASLITKPNSVAGFADDDLFNSFSNDLPSTDFTSQSSAPSFESAQTLLDDNFNPIVNEKSEEEPEKKSSNFFSFEQY